jgi:hypothetical protein
MTLVNCDECGHKDSDRASNCPNCGARFDRTDKRWELIQALGFVIGFVGISMVLFNLLYSVTPSGVNSSVFNVIGIIGWTIMAASLVLGLIGGIGAWCHHG